MIDREIFLTEGLAKYYELKIKEANATILATAQAAQLFIANNGGSVAAAAAAVRSGSVVGSADAFKSYYNTSLDMPQLTAIHKGLTVAGPSNEEFMEIALEDFRARSAVRMNVQEEGKPDRIEVVSRAEAILKRDALKPLTYKGKTDLAEVYLTEKKTEKKDGQVGLFSGKSPIEKIGDFKLENIDVLANNLAVVEYQRELSRVEIPAENLRAAQLSTVRALDEARTKDTDAFISNFFPFLQERDVTTRGKIFGEDSAIATAVEAAQKTLEDAKSPLYKLVSKKGVVGTEHLTGHIQPQFEELYNSLFGMNNLRERRPDVVHPYGALSGLLVNEAMTQIQTSPDGKISEKWIDSATSSVFPQAFVMEAIEHAQENQKILTEFLQVREISPEQEVTFTDAATRLAQVKKDYPKVEQSAAVFVNSVSSVLNGAIKSDRPLSDQEKLVMAQIVAREMTVTAPAGSALKAINVQLASALAQSTEQLRLEGKLPNLGTLNDLALSTMVVHEKDAAGKIQTVPNESLLEKIYTSLIAAQGRLPEDVKFDIPLFKPGQKEPINLVERKYETEREDGTRVQVTSTQIESVTDFSGENKGVLSHTFGSHFFQAAEKTTEEKLLEETPGEKVDDAEKEPEPGVYGTYGKIVQDYIYREKTKSDKKREEIIKGASTPLYDGWKYKLITKTKFYQQKYSEYLQMYMATGGIAPFYAGITRSDIHNATEHYPYQTKVEEVEVVQDPDPTPTPYDDLGAKISESFKTLESMHKRLVQKTVQGDGKDANRGLYFRNDQGGIDAISSQSAMVRNYNSKVANTVLSSIQKAIEENPDRDPLEIVDELKTATRFEKGKEVPVIPNGISISEDGQTVTFFGVSYTRELNPDTNKPTVYAHYNPEGERVPQSTMITIITHDQAEVRDTIVNYMNINKDVIEGKEKSGQAPLIPDDTAVLNAFVQKDPTTGEYGLAAGSDALDRGPSGYDKGALDRADTRAMNKIDRVGENVEIVEAAVIDDPTA